MRIEVDDILTSPGLSKTFSYDGEFEVDELRLVRPVQVKLKLTNAVSRIVLNGVVESAAEQACARCGEDFHQALRAEVEEYAVPRHSPEAPGPEGLQFSEVFTYDEERIELDEIVRQNLLASVPLRPLCSPDCRGLCARCGHNLNEGPCGCAGDEVDSRWEGLLELRAKTRAEGA